MKKKILCLAYINQNLGDDLFVRTVARRYPKYIFVIDSSRKRCKPFLKEKNIRPINQVYRFVTRILCRLFPILQDKILNFKHSRFFGIVKIGGSLFIDSKTNQSPFLTKNVNYYVLGVNYGPEYSIRFRKNCELEFSRAKDVCFRDSDSYNTFSFLPNVRKHNDILFGLDYKVDEIKNSIGISVVDPLLKQTTISRESYIGILSNFCKEAYKKQYFVKLFSFCKNENDYQIALKIKELAPFVEIVNYENAIDRFLDSFLSCEYILGGRFHASIIGWAAGKKVLPVAYSNKLFGVIKDLDYKGPVWDLNKKNISSGRELLQLIEKSTLSFNLKEIKEDSLRQFECLDKILL